MVSDFRRKKLLHVFNCVDQNRSGTLDKKDFELTIENISQSRGYKPGDAKYKEVQDSLLKVWDAIKSRADSDGDGEITLDEWIEMWDEFVKNPAGAAEWQDMYCKFVFQVQDASGDGEVDVDEFSSVCVSFGQEKEASIKAFHRMAKDKQKVTWADFQELWREYLTTDDQDAPGNFIFGDYFSTPEK